MLRGQFYGLVLRTYGLGLFLGLEGPGLCLGLESCIVNFCITYKCKKDNKINNSYNNKLRIIYVYR